MKTAMQELIDWITDPTILENQDKDMAVGKALELLEKEKQQIVDAANYCNTNPPCDNISSGDSYYNETFNQ